MALVAAGVALEALELPIRADLRLVAALVFVGLGLLAAGFSWTSWARTEVALRMARALPGPSLGAVIATGVITAILLIGLGMLLR